MSEINVVSTTQRIVVDPFSSAVAVINAGPMGPPGPPGGVGPPGPGTPNEYVKANGTVPMTGELILPGNPAFALGAATKQFAESMKPVEAAVPFTYSGWEDISASVKTTIMRYGKIITLLLNTQPVAAIAALSTIATITEVAARPPSSVNMFAYVGSAKIARCDITSGGAIRYIPVATPAPFSPSMVLGEDLYTSVSWQVA